MAPAVLKPIVEKAGLTCLAIDLNAEVYDITKQHPDLNLLIKFFFDEEVDTKIEPWLHDMFVSIATSMLSWKPKIIGLSLFSYVCQHSTKWLAYYIRKLDPDV
jgi:hypothetical protein